MAKNSHGRLNRFGSKLQEFWTNNPLLVNGLTIAPVAVASIYLKNAAAISLILAITVIPTLLLASLIKRRLDFMHRVPIYMVFSAVLYAAGLLLLRYLLPGTGESTGMYLPLLVTNTIVVVRAEAFGVRNKTRWVFLDALVQVLGYSFVACVIGAVREYMGNGTVWGITTENNLPISGILLPFSGFILLGLFAAMYQYAARRSTRRRQMALHLQEQEDASSSTDQKTELLTEVVT